MKRLNFKTLIPKIKNLIFRFPMIFKRYYAWFLLLLFFSIIILWGWIFYKYAYFATTTEPEVFVKEPKIPEAELEKILGDIDKRQEVFNSSQQEVYPDPFR